MSNGAMIKSRTLRMFIMMVFDAIAVNLSYFVAFLLRFFVRFRYICGVEKMVPSLWYAAPIYAIFAIIIFYIFDMYQTIWEFAGIRDFNRIVLASISASTIETTLTYFVFGHFPLSVYILGAVIQLLVIAFSRFAYKFYLMERNQRAFTKGRKQNIVVVGINDMARFVMQQAISEEGANVVAVFDYNNNEDKRIFNRINVLGSLSQLTETIKKNKIGRVVIADPKLTEEQTKEINECCDRLDIEVSNFIEFIQNNNDSIATVSMPKTSGARVIPFSPPDISDKEINEVRKAMKSGWITTGPRTKELEKRLANFCGTTKVVCLNSATAAEELNLRILGICEGDEVIVPAYTYTASASAPIHCGATIKFVDIQKDGDPVTHMPEMDYEALAAAITEKTKAIITVDLGGVVCDYDRIFEIVEEKKHLFTPIEDNGTPLGNLSSRIQKAIGRVAIVADCAHSLGASRIVKRTGTGLLEKPERKYCGAIADFTSYSFHAVKNFTTAEGGASTWLPLRNIDNDEIYKMYQLLSLHGQNKDALAKTKVGAWEYDIIGPWYKCNMTDIMAAIGLRQLDRYKGLLERRAEMMKKYDAVCAELGISHMVHHTENMDSSNHLYLIRVPGIGEAERNRIIEKMAERGVATNVHYKPLPMMTAYGKDCTAYPNSYDYYHNLITLPFHTLLSDEDVEYVCKTLKEVVSEVLY